MRTATYWIRRLRLRKHPEGGYYREVYRAEEAIPARALPRRYGGRRAYSTAIYFLLRGRDVSRFHRLESDETWHFYLGSSLTIHIISPNGKYTTVKLGGSGFQRTIPRRHWFGATVDDPKGFALIGCTVAPGFEFADFELGTRAELWSLCRGARSIVGRLTREGELSG